MGKKKLVVSDLDGTLLDHPKKLSDHFVSALNNLIEEGLDFTIATGRDLKKTKKAINGLKITLPVILTNGAWLVDLNSEEILKMTHIPTNIVRHIIEMSAELNIPPMVFGAYDHDENLVHFNKGTWWQKGIHPLTPDQYLPFQDMDVVSIQFHTDKGSLDHFKALIEKYYANQVEVIYINDVNYKQYGIEGEWYWLEINSIEAGKAKMLRYLAKLLNRNLDDIIVFGDNYNDVGMFKIAGKSLAVANAPAEIKCQADEIIGSNLEGGVIEYLLKNKKHLLS